MKKIKKYYNKFNEYVANVVCDAMATMECAYSFLIMSLIPLLYPFFANIIQYISGSIIQLVSLSLILVQGKASEERSKQDHLIIRKSFKELHEVHLDLHNKFENIEKDLTEIKSNVAEILKRSQSN